jgi:hypothetical protein
MDQMIIHRRKVNYVKEALSNSMILNQMAQELKIMLPFQAAFLMLNKRGS